VESRYLADVTFKADLPFIYDPKVRNSIKRNIIIKCLQLAAKIEFWVSLMNNVDNQKPMCFKDCVIYLSALRSFSQEQIQELKGRDLSTNNIDEIARTRQRSSVRISTFSSNRLLG